MPLHFDAQQQAAAARDYTPDELASIALTRQALADVLHCHRSQIVTDLVRGRFYVFLDIRQEEELGYYAFHFLRGKISVGAWYEHTSMLMAAYTAVEKVEKTRAPVNA